MCELAGVMGHTSHQGLSTAFGNVGGQSQFDQIYIPVLDKEELSFLHRSEGQSVLGPIATDGLENRHTEQ